MPSSLTRAVRTQGGAEPLPDGIPALRRLNIRPRRGQVTMLYGIPGAGKTFLALLWSIKMRVDTLFFSLDTDPGTMLIRALSATTGATQRESELVALDKAGPVPNPAPHIAWCFRSEADLEVVDLEIRAYREIHGDYPSLIVVDNLTNIAGDAEGEWSAAKLLMKAFHSLAREYGCAVWVLHHANENGPHDVCPPRNQIAGKLAQYPELILSLGYREHPSYPGTFQLGICKVKDRMGKADPSGRSATWLPVDLDRMVIYDSEQHAAAARRLRAMQEV